MVMSGLTGVCARHLAIACIAAAIAAGVFWTDVSWVTRNTWPGGEPDLDLTITPRPCFICGRMMDIQKPTRQLVCPVCDVLEACDPLLYSGKLAAISGQWQGEEVIYLDHGKVYAPTP